MESTVLSVGKSALNGALGYASSAVAEEVALQLGIHSDHEFIRDELEMMQSFLMAAHEEQENNKVVKTWVKQVRDVAYDVEDSLQDFAVHLEEPSCWCAPRTLLERRRVAKKMKELRAKVEDVSTRNVRYGLIKGSGSKDTTAAAGQSTVADEPMFGIEDAKVDLVRLINKEDEDLRVISVWGPSGHPRQTSIIEMAYDDLKKSMKFQCYAFIRLIHPFSQTNFLQSIVSQFYANSLQDAGEVQEEATDLVDVLRRMGTTEESALANALNGYVNEKSYLIVLDDLSTIKEWDVIKACFPNNKRGSRIIVCTEQVEVARLCIGPESVVPEHKQLSANQTLYAFYEKGSHDGTDSTKPGSSSNEEADGKDTAALKESQLIGRVDEKENIIKLISNKDNQRFEVISMWGMGGLGKTTLVRDVYRSQELSGIFEIRAWVTVMRPFNYSQLLQSLATQFGIKDVTELLGLLEGKRYLIVLDDVWSTKEWDDIMKHLPKTAGSCVIVTTREEIIAKHCSNNEERNIHKLKILDSNHARELFTKKVFKETTNWEEKYPELVGQAEPILKKCKGLPLAIVTIGGFLSSQPKTALVWRKLNLHISAELEMNPELEPIRTVLVKSYDGLQYHLKSCFLYLSIFPEDYKVRRKRLVQRWIAEGYSRVVRGKLEEEIADSYFMELISRSMILPAQQSIDQVGKGIDYCQLHDLMREISISKSMEESLVFRVEAEGRSFNTHQLGAARHLAISSNWEGDKSEFESMVDLSRVRSLTVFGKWRPFFISDKMRFLRVLDLEDTKGLVNHHLAHIGKLLHLKYLSLRGCGDIWHLPDSLGDLRQLQTLDIRGTNILVLPKSIMKLRKLQYLYAGRSVMPEKFSLVGKCILLMCLGPVLCSACCVPELFGDLNRRDACTWFCCMLPSVAMMDVDSNGVFLPRGSRKLKALRTLRNVHLAWGNHVIQEIKKLTGLRKLGVVGINKKNGPQFCSAISNLSRLESLSVRGADSDEGLCGCLDTMDSPPPENLQSFKLCGKLVRLPEWIRKLQNLVKLGLEETRLENLDDTIQVLGKLPNLAILRLLDDSLQRDKEHILSFRGEGLFPSLTVLDLSAPRNINLVEFEEGATPKLEVLQFRARTMDAQVGFLRGLRLLPMLKEFRLKYGVYNKHFVEAVRTQLANNPNKPVFT